MYDFVLANINQNVYGFHALFLNQRQHCAEHDPCIGELPTTKTTTDRTYPIIPFGKHEIIIPISFIFSYSREPQHYLVKYFLHVAFPQDKYVSDRSSTAVGA